MPFVTDFLAYLKTVVSPFCTGREFAFFAVGLGIGFFVSWYFYLLVKDIIGLFVHLGISRKREAERRENRRIQAEKTAKADELEKEKKKLSEECARFNELVREHRITRLEGGFFSALDGAIICPECLYNSDALVRMKHEHVPAFGRIDFICPSCGYVKVPLKGCTLKPVE